MKRNRKETAAIFQALLAALFYALNMPCAKILLQFISSTILAGLLYLGAGIGMGLLFLTQRKRISPAELLSRSDLPYTIGMIVLDILAPICLMYGLLHTTSANASLLNNFEIAATTILALVFFKEPVSWLLWLAVGLVTFSSILLTVEDVSSFQFSFGSVFVLLAAICWGLENNCTRKISGKSTYEIVAVKGLCSGLGSLLIGFVLGESLPALKWIVLALLLGFVAYGLSIFFYIKAQKNLGAARTSAYYGAAPFAGAFLSFLILNEPLSPQYLAALVCMIAGSLAAAADTLSVTHAHLHPHRKAEQSASS